MKPFKGHPSTCGQLTSLRTSHSKSSLGNFQHWYLPEILASVYSNRVVVKIVSYCYVHGRQLFLNLLYKAEKPSVCLSVRPSVCTFWHADNSAVSAWIETGLARNESCIFEDHKVYFYKPIVPTVHWRECLEDKGVSSHKPVKQRSVVWVPL